ncbi:uncharacterized protein TNCV_349781 [Trichonephila clavipes]|nr:uncharacterized protein TNCV_349781 [Trichonephila clavipes]
MVAYNESGTVTADLTINLVTGSRVFSLICLLGSLGSELMTTLFQPNQEVKREGKTQIRKLLNNRSLESSPGEGPRLVSDIRVKVSAEYSHGLCAVKGSFVKSILCYP